MLQYTVRAKNIQAQSSTIHNLATWVIIWKGKLKRVPAGGMVSIQENPRKILPKVQLISTVLPTVATQMPLESLQAENERNNSPQLLEFKMHSADAYDA